MYISPYIEQSLENPAAKIFSSPEDVLHDLKLDPREKQLMLKRLKRSSEIRRFRK